MMQATVSFFIAALSAPFVVGAAAQSDFFDLSLVPGHLISGVLFDCACMMGGGEHSATGDAVGGYVGGVVGGTVGTQLGSGVLSAGAAIVGYDVGTAIGSEIGGHMPEIVDAFDEANEAHIDALGEPLIGPGPKE